MATRARVLLLALGCLLFAGACVVETGVVVDGRASITIDNQSSFVLIEINVASIDSISWGPNLLGDDVLFPDESITVLVRCDFYDVRVIDEDGFSCVLPDVDLCGNDRVWVIDDFTLDFCPFVLGPEDSG